MKLLKFGLRSWITLASVVSFISGWIILAHAPKPVPPNSAAVPLPTLAPLPPLHSAGPGDDDTFQSPSFFTVQPRTRSGFHPFFTTGGS